MYTTATGYLAPLIAQLIDESLDAALIMDSQSRIRYVNAAMERLCGFGAGELLGESLNGLLPEDIAAAHDAYVQRYIDGLRESTVLGRVRELQVRHRTGEIIPIALKAVDLGAHRGERYFGAFIEDLRPRKALEARHVELLQQLEHQALTDALTGLPNRRAFEREATRAMATSQREKWPATVGIADIDWFKHINDRHGHPVGDMVLRAVATAIQDTIRAGDLCGRIGGEEFGLVLPHASVERAAIIAERIRAHVETQSISTPQTPILVTVSIGLAALDPNRSLDASLAEADAALYHAKLQGRNRVATA